MGTRGIIKANDKFYIVTSDASMTQQIIKQAYKFKPENVDTLIKLSNAIFGHVGWIKPYAAKQARSFAESPACPYVFELGFSTKKIISKKR